MPSISTSALNQRARSWSEANKAVMKHFEKEVARQYDGFDFDDRYKAETLDAITMTTEIFRKIIADIENNEGWVKGFKKEPFRHA